MSNNRKVLQIGLGGFGKNHLRAWHEIGWGSQLHIADLSPKLLEECRIFGMPQNQLGTDYKAFLDQVDIVDIVTPSTSHFALCKAALEAGKDVFVEKPMTMTSEEATQLAALVEKTGRTLQVGYYYRYHPISLHIKERIEKKTDFGALRYISGNFMGFKRARTDVGVTHTDGIHFIDLFNWFMSAPPSQVYAVIRDHFKRGMEDLSVVLLTYPNGQVAKVESGYIQPGRWHDKVVPNAFTSKEIFVCGEKATAEADFETENLLWHDVRHEFQGNTWYPVGQGSAIPSVAVASPIKMISEELKAFLKASESGQTPEAGVVASGVVLARIMEAIYESAKKGTPVSLSWSARELESFAKKPELIRA